VRGRTLARCCRCLGSAALVGLVWGSGASAGPLGPPRVQHVMLVVLENADYDTARAQPFLTTLAREGALLRQSFAVTHPSQPNYLALTAGTTSGVDSNTPVTLDIPHIGDLLEVKGRAWKVYAEGYPGQCFMGPRSDAYVRRHVPFLSFRNVQSQPARCARIVDAATLAADIRHGTLPDYALYVPDLRHDGHDTGVRAADEWLSETFGPRLRDPRFTEDMVFMVTFDEGPRGWWRRNRVYTVVYGDHVIPGSVSDARYDHFSLLRTIEELLGLGTLGQQDAKASPITGVWRVPS
jgi:phosphoesterase family protein